MYICEIIREKLIKFRKFLVGKTCRLKGDVFKYQSDIFKYFRFVNIRDVRALLERFSSFPFSSNFLLHVSFGRAPLYAANRFLYLFLFLLNGRRGGTLRGSLK